MKRWVGSWLVLLAVMSPVSKAADGLIAYWPFDTDFRNIEGNETYDGIPSGTAVISNEDVRVGAGALKIDDDGTTASHVAMLGDFVGPAPVVRTMVGWYKYADISGDGSDDRNFIWETQPGYSLSFGIRNGDTGKYTQWYFDTETQGALNGAGPVVEDGQWHHVAIVWNTFNSYLKYYHDGQLFTTVAVAAGNNPDPNQAGLNIGTHRAADGSRNWDGYLDEIAVFDVELSEDQVAALYNEPDTINPLNVLTAVLTVKPSLVFPPNGAMMYADSVVLRWDSPQFGQATYDVWLGSDPNALSLVALGIADTQYIPEIIEGTTYFWKVTIHSFLGDEDSDVARFEVYKNQGLVAYWPFDADYRNALGDSRYDGVVIDTGECVAISPEQTKVGAGALRLSAFDSSVHGLVQIPTSPFFAGQRTMSITCWYQYKDIAGNGSTSRPFVFETAPNYVVSYGTRFETGGLDLGEWYLLGTPGFSDTSGPVDPNAAGWHHVALVYDAIAGTGSFYFDGELRDQLVGTPYEKFGDGLAAQDVLNIGDYRAADGGRMWDGYIDDVAAFDVALTAKQVKALYDGTYDGNEITPVTVLAALSDVYAKGLQPTGEKVSLDTNLSWQTPQDVESPTYRVYFGTDSATAFKTVYATTSDPNLDVTLEYGKTYYWRVDVVTGTTVFEGTASEFSTVAGLVAYYPFDTNLANAAGDPLYDGQAIGNAVISAEDVAVGAGALKIDDATVSANLVTIEPSPVAANQKQVSVTGWFKFKDISNDGSDARPFVIESSDYNISYGTRIEGDALDGGEWYMRGSPSFSDTTGPMIGLADPWHHFALVYDADAGYAEFYFDGQLWDRYEATPGTGLSETQFINIGDYRNRDGGRNFDGYIDDVAFFDVVLNANQIQALYESPQTVNGGNVLSLGL